MRSRCAAQSPSTSCLHYVTATRPLLCEGKIANMQTSNAVIQHGAMLRCQPVNERTACKDHSRQHSPRDACIGAPQADWALQQWPLSANCAGGWTLTRGTRCTWLSREDAREPEAWASSPTEPWRIVTSPSARPGVKVPCGDASMPAGRTRGARKLCRACYISQAIASLHVRIKGWTAEECRGPFEGLRGCSSHDPDLHPALDIPKCCSRPEGPTAMSACYS